MEWEDPTNPFIKEPSKKDGKPVGHRRGQCFRARLEDHVMPTDEVVYMPGTEP